jgi:murein DD-endopeptidase MepM/ murein hydrolase activator NlpD
VLYASPFGGTSARPLIQGFDGDETHLGSMRYALDIAMPSDTPVFAARDGVVLYLQDGFTEGGTDPRFLERSNLVVVAHRDGTMASYGHLSRGLEVRVGDTVSVGDQLGWSGATGFAGQPHLHFHVGVRMLGEPGRTIPIRLDDGNGRPLQLTDGVLIEPSRQGPMRRYF